MDIGQKYSFIRFSSPYPYCFSKPSKSIFYRLQRQIGFEHGNSVIAHDVDVVVIVALDGVRHYVVRASQFIYAVQLCISGRGYFYRFEAVNIKIIFAVLRPNYGRKFGIVLKRPRF